MSGMRNDYKVSLLSESLICRIITPLIFVTHTPTRQQEVFTKQTAYTGLQHYSKSITVHYPHTKLFLFITAYTATVNPQFVDKFDLPHTTCVYCSQEIEEASKTYDMKPTRNMRHTGTLS